MVSGAVAARTVPGVTAAKQAYADLIAPAPGAAAAPLGWPVLDPARAWAG